MAVTPTTPLALLALGLALDAGTTMAGLRVGLQEANVLLHPLLGVPAWPALAAGALAGLAWLAANLVPQHAYLLLIPAGSRLGVAAHNLTLILETTT